MGGRVATPDVNINLYNNTDEAVAVAGLRRPSCSDRLPTRTPKLLLDLDMAALPLLHIGTVHNVLHYLRDNQTLRWEGGWIYAFYGHTYTKNKMSKQPQFSLAPDDESPSTYTRDATSLPLRVRTGDLQLPNRTEIIQMLRTFRNRPYLSALLIRTTMCRNINSSV